MALADIFNPTFFLILGIVMLLLGLLVIYFETKLRDQNHKISSMVSLVSAMAEEIRGRKPNSFPMNAMNTIFPMNAMNSMNSLFSNSDTLIPVSDNEEEDEDEDDDNEDEEDEEDEDEDEDEDENNDYYDDDQDDEKSAKTMFIKQNDVINIGNENQEKINFLNSDDIDDENDLEDMDELNDLVNELEETNFDTDIINIKEDGNNFDFLKTIHISNLEEENGNNKFDYKKYSLNKLRNVVVEKGLVTDSSKLKKHELWKLLGLE
jgi:hypothetical protein